MTGKVKFVKRGGSPVVTITGDDLASSNNVREIRDIVSIERAQESELPKVVNVGYINKQFDYQQGVQSSRRMTVNSINEATIDLPIVLSDNEARRLADTYLYNAWTSRNSYTLSVSTKYKYIEPSDVIRVNVNNDSKLLLVVKTNDSLTGTIQLECVTEDDSNYFFTSTGGSAIAPNQQLFALSKTRIVFLDINLLRDQDNNIGTYVALNGFNEGWAGCVVFKSEDDGDTYSEIDSVDNGVLIGSATSVLGDGRTDIFDEKNTVDITFPYGGELDNVSELAVLAGANAILIGNEILQFKNAELIDANRYRISGLLRGRRGTEYATNTHAQGDLAVYLNEGLTRFLLPSADIGVENLYKAVTYGGIINDATPKAFTLENNGFNPYAPVQVIGVQSNVAGDCVLRWVRRARVNAEWRNSVDVPLGEATEEYELEILDGAGLVVRTVTSLTSPIYTYTIADQNTDFPSGIPTEIDVIIYQISDINGRGYGGRGKITRY
jgi:hypothetical protein